MNNIFWAGIFLGFLLSILGSVIANLYIEKIRNFIDTVSIKSKNRTRDFDKKTFYTLHRIYIGRDDKYLYFIFKSARLIIITVMFSTAFIFGFIIDSRYFEFQDFVVTQVWTGSGLKIEAVAELSLFLVGSICFWIILKELRQFVLYWKILDDFGAYKEALIEKWGEDWTPNKD